MTNKYWELIGINSFFNMNLDIKIYMHFPWHCGLLCRYLEKFAKSMHLLQTLLYWLCIYTYLSFVTLHCVSSWFISSFLQWSGLTDKYIVCWYTCLGVLSELSFISLICVAILVKCAMSWFLAICVLDFLLMYIDLCFYALKSTNDC